ncbi:hypothetical protein QF205_10800 [Luteimonas composti]|uniref:MarR family transcriptional regulator n=1 Tax=Luteimonas composti TaxID=398257 RepID=A0ABT6MT84_9GAMM|nr:hypothetical protein [Luteimonas composti]MDH7453550.1 hypothetical protein [Luteimonas composti]
MAANSAGTAPRVTPLERTALLAAYGAPGHTLRRFGGGFVAAPPRAATTGTVQAPNVTKRMALRLQRADLVQLDDEYCPSYLTLTDEGVAIARELVEAANEAAP